MKTETHTPGPWSIVTTKNGNFEVNSADSVVVVVLGSDEKSEPDARLIAAAPDLLEALRDLIGIANALYGKTIMANGQYVIVSDAISQAESAIDKARGAA